MSLGFIFALFALSVGTLFFLYAAKYYITLALVLTFSRRASRNNNHQNAEGRKNANNNIGYRSGLVAENNLNNNNNNQKSGGIFYRLFGKGLNNHNNNNNHFNNNNNHGLGMIPDYEKLKLKRQPFISIHLPLYNEKKVANRILTACTSFDYENYEVVVVDDSTDETVQILEKWKEHPKVKVIHRTSRKDFKGGALKVALEHSDPRTAFVIVFDADFIPYPDTIWQFLKYFNIGVNGVNGANGVNGVNNHINNIENGNYKHSNIAAVQGYQWHVLNKNENWITRGVRTEFAGSYVVERPGTEVVGSMKLIAGSVYMIRADILRKYGWGTSITEDFQLTLRLSADGYKVIYTPYIQTPSECVSTIKRLVRQRMRWAEGHTHNVKKMFWKILRSPHLQKREKLEFLYLSPYYLQAAFFLTGTLCWFISDAILRTPLPFWTALWGWSLVLTNLFALPLMNGVGLFLEESPQKDYLGIFSFILLSYILVPFQAYAAVKGLFEKEEGHWFRTPKSGHITDVFLRSRFRRFFEALFPGRRGRVVSSQSEVGNFAYATANNRFDNFGIRKRNLPWLGKVVLIILLALALNLVIFARNVPEALANNSNVFYLRSTQNEPVGCPGDAVACYDLNQTAGAATQTVTFDDVTDIWYWYSIDLPTGGADASISAGNWNMHWHGGVTGNCGAGGAKMNITTQVDHVDAATGGDVQNICAASQENLCSAAAFPHDFTLCNGAAQGPWADGSERKIRLKITFFNIGKVTDGFLDFNNTGANPDSNLQTPTITVPEYAIALLAIVPFLPLLIKKLQERRLRA